MAGSFRSLKDSRLYPGQGNLYSNISQWRLWIPIGSLVQLNFKAWGRRCATCSSFIYMAAWFESGIQSIKGSHQMVPRLFNLLTRSLQLIVGKLKLWTARLVTKHSPFRNFVPVFGLDDQLEELLLLLLDGQRQLVLQVDDAVGQATAQFIVELSSVSL